MVTIVLFVMAVFFGHSPTFFDDRKQLSKFGQKISENKKNDQVFTLLRTNDRNVQSMVYANYSGLGAK